MELSYLNPIRAQPESFWVLVQYDTPNATMLSTITSDILHHPKNTTDLTTGSIVKFRSDGTEKTAEVYSISSDREYLETQMRDMTRNQDKLDGVKPYAYVVTSGHLSATRSPAVAKLPLQPFKVNGVKYTYSKSAHNASNIISQATPIDNNNCSNFTLMSFGSDVLSIQNMPTHGLTGVLTNVNPVQNLSSQIESERILNQSLTSQIENDRVILQQRTEELEHMKTEQQVVIQQLREAKALLNSMAPMMKDLSARSAQSTNQSCPAVGNQEVLFIKNQELEYEVLVLSDEDLQQEVTVELPEDDANEVTLDFNASVETIQSPLMPQQASTPNAKKGNKPSAKRRLTQSPFLPAKKFKASWSPDENQSPNAFDDECYVQIGPNGTTVQKSLLKSIKWNSHTDATRKLLSALFDKDVLASHSLTGKPSPAFPHLPCKQQLDPNIINDIIPFVVKYCDKADVKEVRNAVTTKCADENKMLRNRLIKEKAAKNSPSTSKKQQ